MKNYFYILMFLFSMALFASCDNKFEPPKSNLNAEDTPDHESWNSEVTFSDSGNVKAILKAGKIYVFNNKGYTLIDSSALVDFYNKGEKVSTLPSMRGKILEPSKDIEIYDSVVVISRDGSILRTQKLLWNNKTQRVSSDLYVKITTPKEEVEGIGFESDQMLKNYTIFKVTGTFSK